MRKKWKLQWNNYFKRKFFEGSNLQHTGQFFWQIISHDPDCKASKIDFMVNVKLHNKLSLHQFVYAFGQNGEKYGIHQRTTPSIYKLTT